MKKIAILGYGTVGSGVAEVIDTNRTQIEALLGEPIEIKYILDLRDFPGDRYESAVVKDFSVIVNDPEVYLVAETMGGSHPAYDFSLSALKAGKSVVTSNKEVVAKFGKQLLAAAKEHGVRYLFEASVGGGIPIIRPMIDSLAGNRICSVTGILNGTTNYILGEMANGKDFASALSEAQQKGFAEKDPTADVDGVDAKRKICILAAIAFGKIYSEEDVNSVGIREIDLTDTEILRGIGAKIKLIGWVRREENGLSMGVAPCVAPSGHPLYSVDGVYNGILVRANALGDVMFYGSGAGKLPTASAVVSDIMEVFANPEKPQALQFLPGQKNDLCDPDAIPGNYYLRTQLTTDSLDCKEIAPGAYIVHGVSRARLVSAFPDAVIYQVL